MKHIAFQPTVGFASIARIAQVVHKNTCLLCKLNSNTMKSDYAIAAEKLQKQQLRGCTPNVGGTMALIITKVWG